MGWPVHGSTMTPVQIRTRWILDGPGRVFATFDLSHFPRLHNEGMPAMFTRFSNVCWRCELHERHTCPITWEERAWHILVALRASNNNIAHILRSRGTTARHTKKVLCNDVPIASVQPEQPRPLLGRQSRHYGRTP